ncbi:MAG TPA: hypothetical protein VFK05_13865 [Polyangiaceae bacterium]|nr:hypothetical protein [Polyangiaceae bacterium]
MSRGWALALPVLTVLVVGYAMLVAGVPRKLHGARIYGGPSEGVSTLSLRVESVEREGEHESAFWNSPLSARVRASAGPEVALSLEHALHGVADFEVRFLRPVHGPVELELRDASGVSLVSGRFELDVTRWAARARRRGGWIRGRADGALQLALAAERGAFVIGSPAPLAIRVERGGQPVVGASLSVSTQGGRLSGAEQLRSNERGRARVMFEAHELNPTLRVEARTDEGLTGAIETPVAIAAGAFQARSAKDEWRVEIAVPREEAFYSLVSQRARLAGGVLALVPDGRGGSFGTLRLSPRTEPAWLVVSSEVDQDSAAAVGWPLDSGPEPAQTFDVPDTLLLDGLPSAFVREQARRSRVRWLTAAFIGFSFLLSVALLVLRVRAADREISRHLGQDLEQELATRIAPRRVLPVIVAVLAILLGFSALGLVVLARSVT